MKTAIKTIVIDDESLAIKRLRRLLDHYSEEIEIVGEASNGEEGLKLIEQLHPDLIFLDIEMPILNGFEMLKRLNYLPKVIFTTAFEEYAIKAFEENSIDYLLKPIEPDRLDKAIEKLKRLSADAPSLHPDQLNLLLNSLNKKTEFKSIPVKIGNKILLIKPDQIAYFTAKDKYVYIVTDENTEYLSDFTLNSLEEKLPGNFLRVHRAYIINSDKIKELHKEDNSTFCIMLKDKNNSRIYSGRSYNDRIKESFGL